MPIIENGMNVIDLTVEQNEQRKGTVEFEFEDGRKIRRNFQAPDGLKWSNLLADLPDRIEAEIRQTDAANGVGEDREVEANGDASREEVALAYLRNAFATSDSMSAYRKFAKFNTFRLARGWNINQVATALASVGLTADEWDQIKARYIYLSKEERVTAMVAYKAVVDGDTWR